MSTVRATMALVLLVVPSLAYAQASRIKPIPLISPPPAPGVIHGDIIGTSQRDTGRAVNLPRTPTRGSATWAVELDTFDMRRKWTIRFRPEGHENVEVVIRKADTLPPEPITYDLILLATGISHADPKFLAGEMFYDVDGKRRRVGLGGGYDRATFARMEGGNISGAVAVVSGRIDPAIRPPTGKWRYRGLEGQFTARPGNAAPSPAPAVAAESEMRIMANALNGVFISWIGAVNRDGNIVERTPAGVRAFINQRWGTTIAVDSVAITGNTLWVRLQGRATGAVCSQGTSDLMPMCRRSELRRG